MIPIPLQNFRNLCCCFTDCRHINIDLDSICMKCMHDIRNLRRSQTNFFQLFIMRKHLFWRCVHHNFTFIHNDNTVSKFRFSYITRADASNRCPTGFLLQASYDNGRTWTDLRTLTAETDGLPTGGYGMTYTSPVITADKPFTLLRITMTSAVYKNYLVLAEL